MIPASPNHFFLGLLAAAIILAVLVFLPFLTPIVLAAALAVVFGSIHRWVIRTMFKDRERSSAAAFVTLLIVAAIVINDAALELHIQPVRF